MYNYYITVNDQNEIIDFFNSVFKEVKAEDIFYCQNEDRHYRLEKPIIDLILGEYNYWWKNGIAVAKTSEELLSLTKAKENKKVELKQKVSNDFFEHYTLFDIIGALLTGENLQEIKAWYEAKIKEKNNIEALIDAKKNKNTLQEIKF